MRAYCLLIVCLVGLDSFAQTSSAIKWWDPVQHAVPVIEGQAWPDDVEEAYDRLPARAMGVVSEDVWGNSKHAAGLMIRFRTNAEQIIVRYGVKNKGDFAMQHMPATGVSGVDLYAIDSEGNERWCAARRHFADTVIYRYQQLDANDRFHKMGREYRLYLPLYNQVEWLEIGVDEASIFEARPVRPHRPLVVYGTSIAHGACASRPGMAWTAILGRRLDRPLINLGFSGSGRLDPAVINLLTEIDAGIYILDCLPNLTPRTWQRLSINGEQALKERLLTAVRMLRAKRPGVPILLVDHAGYTEDLISSSRKEEYSRVNEVQQEAYYQLKKEGVEQLYYLTKEEIGLTMDDMVDGVHPTDLGMAHYAESYEQKLRAILQEPKGTVSTTQPCTQYREPGTYDWEERHWDILDRNTTDPPKTVWLANSIIHFWGGLPRAGIVREEASWEAWLTPLGVRNYAYGWDRIENVLWRVYHGELDGFEAERILVMIGTNNLHLNTNEEIVIGLHYLIDAIKVRQPGAEVVLFGILPRRGQLERVAGLNRQLARLSGQLGISYADVGGAFLDQQGKLREELFSDGLHPNAAGYVQLREALRSLLPKEDE